MVGKIGACVGVGLLLVGCSWMPLVGSSQGGQITNGAVEACVRKANQEGLNGVGERQATPTGEGRYTVVLDVQGRAGYTQATCSYDPAKGAEIDKSKQVSK